MIRNCLRENRPYPAAIANAPSLELGDTFYYLAYVDLATCRLYEGGAVPYTAVRQYCVDYQLDDESSEMLKGVINGVDAWFADYIRKKEEAEKAKTKAKPRARRGRRK